MRKHTFRSRLFLILVLALLALSGYSQEVPILTYNTNENGQVQLAVASTQDNYYILKVRHSSVGDFELATSITLGTPGITIITEPLGNYPLDHYQVLEHPIVAPTDCDGDGVDDITEFHNIPAQGPFNSAEAIDIEDGALVINSLTTFKLLSVTKDHVQWAEYLDGKRYLKYIISDFNTANPKIYFINTETYTLHEDFANAVGVEYLGDNVKKGEIIYHPTTVSNNGTLGTFTFNYSNGHGQAFEVVQRCYELIAANMPFLKNNLSYFVTLSYEAEYYQEEALFQNSRVSSLFEADVFADVDYWALNMAEGFGYFRQLNLDEMPGSRDIVLLESLPNTLPRVGGIMTSVIQSPLSHVNLRAIQDRIPNAFVRDPMSNQSIASLLDHYIYYKVEQDKYFVREATLAEVNEWFDDIRPQEEQIPALNLTYTNILPLDEISFSMSDGFGAKCANVATMRTFGFPDNTIPDGFGVPFYFYQEFMTYNGFFNEIKTMLSNHGFVSNREVRVEMLTELRTEIENADMPQWMLDELAIMQESFPQGTSIRCRSSSNNEDMPGFSGAGLYTSKTQHPDEGHISKSIKQVYASLWNFRAFDERDFFRVNHYVASMGVLCHPNFKDEKANGVGVSLDPLYQTTNTLYLNSQIGDDLITNPEINSVAEEILLDKAPVNNDDYLVIRRSNLVSNDSLIMAEKYLDQMRAYFLVIHEEFATLYDAVGDDEFAMDIEYKITSDDRLVIKQARPWVSYWQDRPSTLVYNDSLEMVCFPNPAFDYINIQCIDCNLAKIRIANLEGKQLLEQAVENNYNSKVKISVGNLPQGIYIISGYRGNDKRYSSRKIVKR